MQYRILGPLQITSREGDITPTAPKLRTVLALLLMRPNEVIHTQQFIDELWGERPPATALSTLQTYIYKLRKLLAGGDPETGEDVLRTRPHGYVIHASPEQIDLHRFERLVAEGRTALEDGDAETSRARLGEALGLWRGRALADIDAGELLSAYVTRLEEERFRVLEVRIEADLQVGRHQELISELKGLTHTHRLHEGLHAKLMLALQRSGRRHEALDAYQRLRTSLVDELGLEPSLELRTMQQEVLALEEEPPEPAPPAAAEAPAARPEPVESVPMTPPPDLVDFTGRQEALKELERILIAGEAPAGCSPVAMVTGVAGAGKTALAVRAANSLRERYPDGQLFADLHGDEVEASAHDVLGRFLEAAGLASHEVPDTLMERRAVFARWTEDRGVLVLLDNGASSAQVEPLLPSGQRCGAIVTSRSRVVMDAETLELDLPSLDEAVEMLGTYIGRRRVAEERYAAESIVRMCGYLPLAVRSVGTRLAAVPGWPLGKLAGQIAMMGTRIEELCFSDVNVRTGFAENYDRLDERARIVAYRLVSLLQSSEFDPPEAAALFGCDDEIADSLLAQMVEKHLRRVLRQDAAAILHGAFSEVARTHTARRSRPAMAAESLAQDG